MTELQWTGAKTIDITQNLFFSVAPELLGQFYTALAALEEKLGDPRNQVWETFRLFTQSKENAIHKTQHFFAFSLSRTKKLELLL